MKTKDQYLETYVNLIKLSCSGRTIDRYSSIISGFLDVAPVPERATYSQTLSYLHTFNSQSSKKQAQGALKHFFKGVVPRPDLIPRLPKIKQDQKLPEILTETEIQLLLQHTKNLKHKTMLTILYHCGLRINELINIQIKDISGSNRTLHVKFSKGAKHRIVPFSLPVLLLLRKYFKKYRPKNYLFNGQKKLRYTASSVRKFLKAEILKLKINKTITPHSLRHSRATHLLNNGVDIKKVKDFLGHFKIETTEKYLHLTVNDLQTSIENADAKIFTLSIAS